MKVAAACVIALLCLALAGCGDQTGVIDAEGHNGYDRDTCTDSKAFALDVKYGAVTVAKRQERIDRITDQMKRASEADIRKASEALLAGYRAGNRKAIDAAIVSLVQACQM